MAARTAETSFGAGDQGAYGMGAFILFRPHASRERMARAASGLSGAGFAPAREISGAFGTVTLFDPLQGVRENFVETDDGDFAFAVGPLVHRGMRGHAALRRLLADFDPAEFDWSGTLGVYVFGVWKRGRLTLVTDGLGAFKIYTNPRQDVFSSAFSVVAADAPSLGIDTHGCYQYAWNGTVFGQRTFVHEVRSTPCNTLISLAEDIAFVERPSPYLPAERLSVGSVSDAAEAMVARLRGLFRVYADLHGDDVNSALSGGYDSRLLLAALLDAGITPRLFVYDNPGSADLAIAREIAALLGLRVSESDKAPRPEDASLDGFEEHMARQAVVYDGWSNAGIFGGPADTRSRLLRAAGAAATNGANGEILRNFHYLPDRRFTLRDVVSAFYFQLDPAACTERFSSEEYAEVIAAEMAASIGHTGGSLGREQVEMLYPLFRGRYWSARDAVLNQRFGTMLYPFCEADVVRPTYTLRLRQKDMGRLEAEMIRILHPRLAGVRSAYGFAFDRPPTLRHRLAYLQSLYRPVWVRRYTWRVRHRRPEPRPVYLTRPYLERVIDPTFPRLSAYFRMDRVRLPDVRNRIATMEYVLARWG